MSASPLNKECAALKPERHPRTPYPSEVTDQQWAILQPLIPPSRTQRAGRPRQVARREVIHTMLSQNRSGCQWDMVPHALLPNSTVDDYLAQWRDDGTWAPMVAALRTQIRVRAGREPTPSAVCLDRQAVKTTEIGGAARGYDGGKQLKGRQRHLLVDTRGLLVAIVSTGAGVDDGGAAPMLLAKRSPGNFPRLVLIYGDSTYHQHHLHAWLAAHRPHGRLEVKTRPAGATGFIPLEKRWVVERTNAWHGRYRSNRKD